jgi:hypothetical protein
LPYCCVVWLFLELVDNQRAVLKISTKDRIANIMNIFELLQKYLAIVSDVFLFGAIYILTLSVSGGSCVKKRQGRQAP